jgi:Ser/Thr protein kinase RdoA (MazF antagonist)
MTQEKVLSFLNENFRLNATKAEIFRDGPDNTIWSVFGGSERYMARFSKRDVSKDIKFETSWMEILSRSGVPVAELVKTVSLEDFAFIDSTSVVVVSRYIEGKHLSFSDDKNTFLKATRNAAVALAKMHNVSTEKSIDLPRSRSVLFEFQRIIDQRDLIAEKIPGGNGLVKEVENAIKWISEQKTPLVLIHNDFRIGNVLFDNFYAVKAILDFDWSCMGPAIKDVAHSLAEWSFPDGAPKHDEEIFSAFLESYNKETREQVKRDSDLFKWISISCLSDACTFIIDRLKDGQIKPANYSYMYLKSVYFLKYI